MIKIIVGVVIGVLFADTLKHLAVKVYDYIRSKV
jgi:hypothetical protein